MIKIENKIKIRFRRGFFNLNYLLDDAKLLITETKYCFIRRMHYNYNKEKWKSDTLISKSIISSECEIKVVSSCLSTVMFS